MLGTKPWNVDNDVGIVVGYGIKENTYKVAWVRKGHILKRVEHRECFTEISGGHEDGKTPKAA